MSFIKASASGSFSTQLTGIGSGGTTYSITLPQGNFTSGTLFMAHSGLAGITQFRGAHIKFTTDSTKTVCSELGTQGSLNYNNFYSKAGGATVLSGSNIGAANIYIADCYIDAAQNPNVLKIVFKAGSGSNSVYISGNWECVQG